MKGSTKRIVVGAAAIAIILVGLSIIQYEGYYQCRICGIGADGKQWCLRTSPGVDNLIPLNEIRYRTHDEKPIGLRSGESKEHEHTWHIVNSIYRLLGVFVIEIQYNKPPLNISIKAL